MKKNAIMWHLAKIQRYIVRWATWRTSVGDWTDLLTRWAVFTTIHSKEYAWIGRSLVAFA